MPIINITMALLIPWGLGFTLLLNMFANRPLPLGLSLALAYGLGLGALAQWMLILGILGAPLHAGTIGIPLVLLSLTLAFLYQAKVQSYAGLVKKRHWHLPYWGFIEIILVLYIFYFIIYVFWRSMVVPIFNWDAVATVAYKAKVIFIEQSIALLPQFPHAAYPLHTPFLEAWVAFNLQEWNDVWPKIIFPLAYLSYIVIHYAFLKQFTNRRWALFGVVLLISSNLFTLHATTSYRDFFMCYYNCITLMLMLVWYRRQDVSLLILTGLFSGFSTFVKVEGWLYLTIHLLLMATLLLRLRNKSWRQRARTFFLFCLPSVGIFLIFQFYRLVLKIPLEEKSHLVFGWEVVQRIPAVFEKFYLDLFWSGNWNLIWFLLACSLLRFQRIKTSFEAKFLLLALLLHFGLISAMSLFTSSFIWISGEKYAMGLSRLILHFFPYAVLVIILLNRPLSRADQKESTL